MQSFIEIGLHVFPKSVMQTHRQTDAAAWTDRRDNFIYIDKKKILHRLKVSCEGAHPLLWRFEPARVVRPN